MPSPRPSLGLPWNVRSARCHCPPVLGSHTPVAARDLQADSSTATVSIGTAVENVKNILGDSFGRENAREAALAPVARCPRNHAYSYIHFGLRRVLCVAMWAVAVQEARDGTGMH